MQARGDRAVGRPVGDELRREHIGIVFQQSNLLPSLTAREQLLVMGELGGSAAGRRAAIRERGADIMDLIARLTHERGTATMLVTHDLVHRESLDDLVTVVDGAITAPAAPRHPTDAVAVG